MSVIDVTFASQGTVTRTRLTEFGSIGKHLWIIRRGEKVQSECIESRSAKTANSG